MKVQYFQPSAAKMCYQIKLRVLVRLFIPEHYNQQQSVTFILMVSLLCWWIQSKHDKCPPHFWQERLSEGTEEVTQLEEADNWVCVQPGPVGPQPRSQRPSSSEGAPPGPRWNCPHSKSKDGSRFQPPRWLCVVLELAGRSLNQGKKESV